jgi:uncharacterized protein (DUF1501 family)
MCYGGLATFGLPVVNFAQVQQNGRFVFILLRGGFDGLAALVPYGDPDYRALRGSFAYNASDLSTLDDTFGLAPGLSPLRALWDANQLAVVHAMAIPHRTRSHFDGQAILETGLDRPAGSADGWLNRLLQVMSGTRSGIAIAAGMPLSLTGPLPGGNVVAHTARLGGRCVSRAAGGAVSQRRGAAEPLRGGAAAAGARRRRADGAW